MSTTTNSGMFTLNLSDIQKALLMAVLSGIVLPVSLAAQTQGFDVFHINWIQILDVALTGGFVGGVTYLAKNFFSDSTGRVFGKIG